MGEERITLQDTPMSVFVKMSDGNLGAMTVLMDMFNSGDIDPDLTGQRIFVLDFTEKDNPKTYWKDPETEIILCEGKEDVILIEKKTINLK